MRVSVYFNLHRNLFSVVAMEGESKGRVIARLESVCLSDVSFHVSESGRQRVIREKRKNVHAFVRGNLEDISEWGFVMQPRGFSYNPYRAGHFYDRETGNELTGAAMAILTAPNGKPVNLYRGAK